MVIKWVATPAGLPIVENYDMISMKMTCSEGRLGAFDSVVRFYRLPLSQQETLIVRGF